MPHMAWGCFCIFHNSPASSYLIFHIVLPCAVLYNSAIQKKEGTNMKEKFKEIFMIGIIILTVFMFASIIANGLLDWFAHLSEVRHYNEVLNSTDVYSELENILEYIEDPESYDTGWIRRCWQSVYDYCEAAEYIIEEHRK